MGGCGGKPHTRAKRNINIVEKSLDDDEDGKQWKWKRAERTRTTGAFATLRTCLCFEIYHHGNFFSIPLIFCAGATCAMALKAYFFVHFNRDYYPICSGTLARQLLFSHSSFGFTGFSADKSSRRKVIFVR